MVWRWENIDFGDKIGQFYLVGYYVVVLKEQVVGL